MLSIVAPKMGISAFSTTLKVTSPVPMNGARLGFKGRNMVEVPFQDRSEAGRFLGAELASRTLPAGVIVLALPRGGLPVGAEVAAALEAPLDVVVVRKLSVPWLPELAMGAVAGDTMVLDNQLIGELRISNEEVDAVIARVTTEVERREKLYRSGLPSQDLRERAVVIVDDGLATGSTMLAAVRHARTFRPERLIVAVPVGSSQACMRIGREADDCVCLALPEPFGAVSEWYIDFRQITDQEVQEILRRSNRAFEVVP
jgi:putative phosphoribosyl transferase